MPLISRGCARRAYRKNDRYTPLRSDAFKPGSDVDAAAEDVIPLNQHVAKTDADAPFHTTVAGDPDACLEPGGFDIEATDGIDQTQPRPNRSLGIILMRLRIAEIGQNAVTHVFRDKSVEPGHCLRDRTVIGTEDLAQILGVEASREFGRANQITEHDRELTPFCAIRTRR
jgi:hypothetical protein